jgi:D-sedoheptulose 7-phosphate isomerase
MLEDFCQEQGDSLARMAKCLAGIFAEGGQLLVAGNGCLHPAAQLMASQFSFRLSFDRPTLPALCLGSDLVLNSRMIGDGQAEQLFVRHYRAVNSEKHLLLLINDGSESVALKMLRDEVLENGQSVVLISYDCRKDPLLNRDMDICLNLASRSVPRQLELTQFIGHLLCELVETELFGQ